MTALDEDFGIDVRRWLSEWLTACAANGGQPPDDLSPWLPWPMTEEQPARTHGVGMTGPVECRCYGRDFSAEEMALLRALIAGPTRLTRRSLSIEFCRRIGWLKPDGGLKDMMARVTMLAMHRDGLIELPPSRWQRGWPKPIVFGHDTEPPLFPAPTSLDEGRGRYDRNTKRAQPKKDIWLRPLRKNWRRTLNR